MKTFIKPGNVLTCVAPSGGVVSGTFVMIGSIFGVAATSADEGDEFELQTGGCYELAKVSAEAWVVGDPIYWDADPGIITKVATDNTKVGVAITAAANPSGSGEVRLNSSF